LENISEKVVCTTIEEGRLAFERDDCNSIKKLHPILTREEIYSVQSKCTIIRALKKFIATGPVKDRVPKRLKQYSRDIMKFELREDILTREGIPVIPFHTLVDIVVLIHFEMAHIGREKVLKLISKLYWHPKIYKVVNDVCVTCQQCQRMKIIGSPVVPPTWKIRTSYPFEMVAIDLVSLPPTKRKHVAILVLVDHYSKFVGVVPLRDKKSCTVVKAMNDSLIPFLPRIPTKLLSDNGPEFRSELFHDCMDRWNIKHIRTTPYKPSSGGIVERANKTILGFLNGLRSNGEDWDNNLAKAVTVYNHTHHQSINCSPSLYLLSYQHGEKETILIPTEIQQKWRIGHDKFQPHKVGTLVMKRKITKGRLNADKMDEKYDGPYRIMRINSNRVTYELQEARGTDDSSESIRAHHAQLKVWHDAPGYLKQNKLFCRNNDRINMETGELVEVEIPEIENESSSSLNTVDVKRQITLLFLSPRKRGKYFDGKGRNGTPPHQIPL